MSNYASRFAPKGWLDDATSQAYLSAHGSAVLEGIALWREGIKARFASTAPVDALPLVGEARQLEQAPGEAVADYRLRLVRSFEIHEERATKDAYRNALEPLGVAAADIAVWNDHEDTLIPATPPDTQWWSRVTVIANCTGGPWIAPVWLDPDTWSDSEVWGVGDMTQAQLRYIRRCISNWKWTGAYPLGLVLIFDDSTYDLTTNWSLQAWVGSLDLAVIPLGRVWDWNAAVYGAPDDLWSDTEVWEGAFTFD